MFTGISRRTLVLAERLRAANHSLRLVISNRQLLRRWLLGSRRPQIALAVCMLAGLLAVPPAVDAVSDAIFPPKKTRRLFRTRTRPNLAGQILDSVLTGIYWTGAVGTTLVLFWLELPVVVGLSSASPVDRSRRAGFPGEPGTSGSVWVDREVSPTDQTLLSGSSVPGLSEVESVDREAAPAVGGRYSIEDEIGGGSMGVVFRARDQVLGRAVALKALPQAFVRDRSMVERFRQEARVVAELTHPHIVQVYDLVEDKDSVFMAMELVSGRDLAAHLEERGRLALAEMLELALPLAQGLAYAHDKGVVHRDFKPHNVLVGEDGQLKITDFGLAKGRGSPQLTQAGSIIGSPSYLSPEQAEGRPTDARSDIYSFGCTLYEMLTGRPPFVGELTHVLLQHVSGEHTPVRELAPDIPESLSGLIDQMLAKDPDSRVPDMQTVIRGLEEAAAT